MLTVCIAFGPRETLERLINTLDSVNNSTYTAAKIIILPHHDSGFDRHLHSLSLYKNATIVYANDSGIFHAQNIMAMQVSTKYLMFLGCGDIIADSFALEDVVEFISCRQKKTPLAYYTPVLVTSGDRHFRLFDNSLYFALADVSFNVANFLLAINPLRNPMHTQGLIYNTIWFQSQSYTLSPGLYSDFLHTIQFRLYSSSTWIPRPLSIFIADGESSQKKSHSHFLLNLSFVASAIKPLGFSLLYRLIGLLKAFLSTFYFRT